MKARAFSSKTKIEVLQKRARELDCLYQIAAILHRLGVDPDRVCPHLVQAIPRGYQYPEICKARIVLEGNTYCSAGFVETKWQQSADIEQGGQVLGTISVFYTESPPIIDHGGPFLHEEARMLRTIANRLGQYVTFCRWAGSVGGLRSRTTQATVTRPGDQESNER